jgi:ribonucleoside-diphosphate reductase alpha chain
MGNTSPSIEPWRANAYRQDTLSGSYLNKNKYLDTLIKERCHTERARAQEEGSGVKYEYDKIWAEIIANEGSVQTLRSPLTSEEKEVYKTSMEIDQRWVIEHAADRQKFIDQAQSLNVFFRPDANIKYLHAVHFLAWKSGLKTLYYCRSEKIGKADKISKQIERQIIKEIDIQEIAQGEPCLACEG